MKRAISIAAAFLILVAWPLASAMAQSDWDAYMLQLVNRARTDPAAENAIHGTSYSHAPVSPLAYNTLLASAAEGHNTWMHLNIGNTSLTNTSPPRSFAHFQTHNGNPGGTPLTGSPGFTGAGIAERVTASGFNWWSIGENLASFWASWSLPVNAGQIEANHEGWWNSEGHRLNMMEGFFLAFGHFAETRTVTPNAQNNFQAWATNLHLATQVLGRPHWDEPQSYVFGLLYDDLDASGQWTPRNAGDPLREGLAGVGFDVFDAGTSALVTSGATWDNGAFTVPIDPGLYTLVFSGAALPSGSMTLTGIEVIDDYNTDLGTILAVAGLVLGDFNGDGVLSGLDIPGFKTALADPDGWASANPARPHPNTLGDFNNDGVFSGLDIPGFKTALAGGVVAVPEPGVLALLALGFAGFMGRRRQLL